MLLVAAGVAACSGTSEKLTGQAPSSTTSPIPASTTSTTNPDPPVPLSLYFLRGSTLGVATRIAHTKSERYTALSDLFAGPDRTEAAAGLSSDIPSGSAIEGLTVVNGVAYLNVNGNFFLASPTPNGFGLRLAQVVYTLTAGTGVSGVEFLLHAQKLGAVPGFNLGAPVTRSMVTAAAGPVLLESPAVGSTLTNPLQLSGMSQVDGTLEARLVGPAGKSLAESVATVAKGETFDLAVPFTQTGSGVDTLEVFIAPTGSSPVQQTTNLSLPYSF